MYQMVQGCRGQVRIFTTWNSLNMVIIAQSPFIWCLRIPGIGGMRRVYAGRGER